MRHSGEEVIHPGGSAWLSRLFLVLLLSYPFALHLGVLNDRLLPALVLLLIMILLLGLLMLTRGNRLGWLVMGAAPVAAVWVSLLGNDPETLLKLPPVVISGLLGLVFGHTLLPGEIPLISRFAELMHGHALDERALRYTRRVTWVWTVLFACLTLESLLLALFADDRTWSLFTNFINYLVILLVFIIEYRIRVHRLDHLQHPGFVAFLVALRRIDWRRLR